MRGVDQNSVSTHVPLPATSAPSQASPATAGTLEGEAQLGMGGLQGLQISVGTACAAPQPVAISDLSAVVQASAQSVQLQPRGAIPQAPRVRSAVQAQPTVDLSALYIARPGGVATNAKVMDSLQAQQHATGTQLSAREISSYVALGEHAFHAIQQPATKAGHLLGCVMVNTVNPPVILTPNLEVTRGIAMYMAACAVQPHADGGSPAPGGPPSSVGGVFNDPDNAVYNFLQSCPLAYSPESPHGNGQAATTGQRGIEDYDRRLPGNHGAIVFGKVQDADGQEQMFLQLERSGRPPVFGSASRVDDRGQGAASGWRALVRMMQNSLDYLRGRWTKSQPEIPSVTIDMKPTAAHYEKAHDGLTRLFGAAAKAQGVLVKEYAPPHVLGTHTIPGSIYRQAPKDWNRDGITIDGVPYHGHGHEENVSSHKSGRQSTLEQACSAFEKICGNNPVAANWISRFATQETAGVMMQYLMGESLGTAGSNISVDGRMSLDVTRSPDGAVALRVGYRYQNSVAHAMTVNRDGGLKIHLNAQASLHATVTLRFDHLDSYTPDKAPVPEIISPLKYTTSNFDPA